MHELLKIFKIEAEQAEKITASPDKPHYHNYEELIIGIQGTLEHFIDFNTVELEAPLISCTAKGKMHRAVPMVLKKEQDKLLASLGSKCQI